MLNMQFLCDENWTCLWFSFDAFVGYKVKNTFLFLYIINMCNNFCQSSPVTGIKQEVTSQRTLTI